jgi:hypothetical protein
LKLASCLFQFLQLVASSYRCHCISITDKLE